MNCRNCGATMELARGAARLECSYCGSQQRLGRREDGATVCGVVRIGAATEPELACPRCRAALVSASLDGEAVALCDACDGLLAPRESFARVVRTRRMTFSGIEITPQPIEASELSRQVQCPRCARTMETHPYFGSGAVVVDSCAGCGLIWLDAGELTEIESAPGKRQW